jgi:hypothetical protein
MDLFRTEKGGNGEYVFQGGGWAKIQTVPPVIGRLTAGIETVIGAVTTDPLFLAVLWIRIRRIRNLFASLDPDP